jgi:hypothetical protein
MWNSGRNHPEAKPSTVENNYGRRISCGRNY